MWAGQLYPKPPVWGYYGGQLSNQGATAYCANLTIAGFSVWRLPTLDEVKAATTPARQDEITKLGTLGRTDIVYNGLFFKGRTDLPPLNTDYFWTSTKDDKGQIWVAYLNFDSGPFFAVPPDHTDPVLCVRPMDPEMAALAKEAQVDVPISSLQDLQAYAALAQARASYLAGNFNDSLQKAQSAMQLKPDLIPANIGAGLSYGLLGEWDQAVSTLQSARSRLGSKNREITAALKWAESGQKAAAKGKQPKGMTPVW